ncbi:MAG: nucleoside deaminase [Chitinophagaceae bacterium]
MLNEKEILFLEKAIEVAKRGMETGKGGPFGCVIVRDNEVIAEGCNLVTSTNDPTAHAEVVAIREACKRLQSYELTDCDVYASCEPCPMCLGAIYWARVNRVIYASTRHDAAAVEFDDDFIYKEIGAEMEKRKIPFIHYAHPKAAAVFNSWVDNENKKRY